MIQSRDTVFHCFANNIVNISLSADILDAIYVSRPNSQNDSIVEFIGCTCKRACALSRTRLCAVSCLFYVTVPAVVIL